MTPTAKTAAKTAAKPAAKDRRQAGAKVPDSMQGYLDAIAKYERAFKKWEDRADKIVKKYRDESRITDRDVTAARFNILWSNVQVLVPACFARVPQPDVSRRFQDQDSVGRVAGLLLERGLEYEVQHYPDYAEAMTQCVRDRFLGGRGTAWVRYEPHLKESHIALPADKAPEDGVQVTEDVDNESVEEEIDYECAPVDYVHWRDFGHSVARTWEEVTLVWRRVFMSKAAVVERFGEDVAGKIPYDASPEDLRRGDANAQVTFKQQAVVYELWDKERGIAVWFSKAMKEFLDERDDPLNLQRFFPCPKPLFATLTNESLIPVPDFTLYQDQAMALDTLADRIGGLINMLQVKGVYDGAADPAIGRLFTEGVNGTLMPVKNYAGFAEKQGLRGQIDVLDLTPIAKALETSYIAVEQQKNQVYEIMGISDIVRGMSDPNETLGAQELKGQYASMRLRAMQADVARFATDILQIKAQVMCGKFNPQTLLAISAAEQLNPIDQQQIMPALALLVGEDRMVDPTLDAPNPLRSFRIEVNADTMVQMNEAQEKRDRVEFLTAVGGFMEKATPVVQAAPTAGPLVAEMLKFGISAFKVGKTVEGKFDELIDKMTQAVLNPAPPPPNPKVEAEKARAQADMAKAQMDVGVAQAKAGIDMQKMQAEQKMSAQNLGMEQQAQQQAQQQEMEARAQQHAIATAQHAQRMAQANAAKDKRVPQGRH
jgi:hypothetical protein